MAVKGLPFIVLAVGDDLFGLYGSECRDELLIGTPPSSPPSLISCMWLLCMLSSMEEKKNEDEDDFVKVADNEGMEGDAGSQCDRACTH